MEQFLSVPFSKVVATLLLEDRNVTAKEIVNYISKISSGLEDIIVKTEDDNFDYLSFCVEFDNNFNFKLKNGWDYDSIINDSITVRDFLIENSLPDYIKDIAYRYDDISNVDEVEDINLKLKGKINSSFKLRKRSKILWLFKKV